MGGRWVGDGQMHGLVHVKLVTKQNEKDHKKKMRL